jgi:integrase
MLAIKHTIFRNGFYHFNIRLGDEHYRKSLKTDSPKQTRKYVLSIKAFVDKEILVNKSELDKFIELLLSNQLNHVVRLAKAATQPLSDTSKSYFSRWYKGIESTLDQNWNITQHRMGNIEEENYPSFNDFISNELEKTCERSYLRDMIIPFYSGEEGYNESIDTEHDLYHDFLFPTKSREYYHHLSYTIDTHSKAMALALKNKQHLHLKAEFKELKNKFSSLLPNELMPMKNSNLEQQNELKSPYFKDVHEEVSSYIDTIPKITQKTKNAYKSKVMWLTPALGEYRISEINADILEDVWNSLRKLPTQFKAINYGISKNKVKKQEHIKNIWNFCQSNNIEVQSKDNLSTSTLKEIRQYLSNTFEWSERQSHIEKSPLTLSRLDTDGPVNKRTLLPLITVKKIISYCLDNIGERESFPVLIMAYHGMRNEEITSLTKANIVTEPNTRIVYINILDGKTNNSKRRIPIHNEVIKAGFMEYIDKKEHKLFEVNSAQLTLKFNSYRKLFEIPTKTETDELLNLYSLRHNVITQLQNSPIISEDHVYKLVGHGTKNTTINYTHENYLLFQRMINQVSYD